MRFGYPLLRSVISVEQTLASVPVKGNIWNIMTSSLLPFMEAGAAIKYSNVNAKEDIF